MMNPLVPHLLVAVLLFVVGMAGALTRRNAILVLVGIELMLNAANLSFLAFWRFGPQPDPRAGLMVAWFAIAIAAAEAAVGLGLILALYRHRRTARLEAMDSLKG